MRPMKWFASSVRKKGAYSSTKGQFTKNEKPQTYPEAVMKSA